MTKPALVFFGFDSEPRKAKIFLRSLLYSTSIRGKVVASMYAKLSRNDWEQIFSFWGYGETEKISPGSGLFVSQSGVAANHHFVLSASHADFEWRTGNYTVQVYAQLAAKAAPSELASFVISVEERHAQALREGRGVLFEFFPDRQSYVGHADGRRSNG